MVERPAWGTCCVLTICAQRRMTPDHLDLIVLYAATSDRKHRTLLMRQLAKKLGVPELKLWRRLERLEAPKALRHYAGKSAIDQYENESCG